MGIFRRVYDFLRAKSELENIESLMSKLNNNVVQAQEQYNQLREMYGTISNVVHTSEGYIWRKDKEDKYKFANYALCHSILVPDQAKIKTTHDCINEVLGHTDDEIFSQYNMRTGDVNSFWATMPIADNYVRESKEHVKMIEFGEINKNIIILQSIRTPLYSSKGEYRGIIGFALDLSDSCIMVGDQISKWKDENIVVQIHPNIYVLKCNINQHCAYDNRIFRFNAVDQIDKMFEQERNYELTKEDEDND